MEESNLLHSLFLNGNYHLIIDKIVSFLDLESLQSLTLVDSLTYSCLKKHLQQKTAFLRYSWLCKSRSKSSSLETIRNDSLSYPVVVCDDLDIILFGEKPLISDQSHSILPIWYQIRIVRTYCERIVRVKRFYFSKTKIRHKWQPTVSVSVVH